jgi:GT2 family glycosyltransferase
MGYSVAIRTLGTSGEKFVRELTSIYNQTIEPEKVVVYIAEGYSRPSIQIGNEEYVWVKKGMVSQRALPYREIQSKYILLLDDDVELQPESVERLMTVAENENADVVGADTFKNQDLACRSKLFAILTNWVVPHWDTRWAFKIHAHAGFSYLNHAVKDYYPSQSCAGPASLWKKESLQKLHLEDETFLDRLGFPFGEDLLTFHKVYINGYKLYIHYQSGIEHLDGKSSSGAYQNNINKFYIRSKGGFILWWRTCYQIRKHRWWVVFVYSLKLLWLFIINVVASVVMLRMRIPYLYVQGVIDAWTYVHSDDYKAIPPLNGYNKV